MASRTRPVVALAVCVALGIQVSQRPLDGAVGDLAEGTTPFLVVSIQNLGATGPGGVEASSAWDLRANEVTVPTVRAGQSDVPGDLCATGSGEAQFSPGTIVGWRVEGRLLSVDASGARVWVRWTRRVMEPSAVDASDLVREYEARLGEQWPLVIDLVRPRAGSSASCDGVVVKMWLELRDSHQLARSVLDYDIWLVHREVDGREVVERAGGRGLQGKRIDYLFKRQRYNASAMPDPGGSIEVDLAGSVKGRVRPDGRIDLSVSANRTTTERGAGSGEGGNKQATVADGETLELEMPPHQFRPAFAAQRTSIRVTVRKVS